MNPLLSPNKFIRSLFMKIEWLVTDVTAVGSPDRAGRAILGVILAVFLSTWATLVVGEPFCDLGIPS